MGVLTDFVVVPRDQAERVLASKSPSVDFDGMDAKGIDTIHLATLYALIAGGEADAGFMREPLCAGGDEGPWVFEAPASLVEPLAALGDRELSALATRWAATEELTLDGWPVEVVEAVLRQVAELCRRARAEAKALLVWMCL